MLPAATPLPHPHRARALGRPLVVAALVLGAVTVAAAPAPPAPPEPPSPVSGPVTHPDADGTGAGGPKGRDAGRAGAGLPQGLDVSGRQPDVDWDEVKAEGPHFAYVKATEGTSFRSDQYRQQYDGAARVGLVRGAYHFALPDRSAAADQATFFVDNGGGWTADGKTLPPMLDIEDNPYGERCYGKSPDDVVAWIRAFSDTVHERTGRFPTIYTGKGFWDECTGDAPGFGANPLFIARYESDPGTMPASWTKATFWQWDDEGDLPGDQDAFMGTVAELQALAAGPGEQDPPAAAARP